MRTLRRAAQLSPEARARPAECTPDELVRPAPPDVECPMLFVWSLVACHTSMSGGDPDDTGAGDTDPGGATDTIEDTGTISDDTGTIAGGVWYVDCDATAQGDG